MSITSIAAGSVNYACGPPEWLYVCCMLVVCVCVFTKVFFQDMQSGNSSSRHEGIGPHAKQPRNAEGSAVL